MPIIRIGAKLIYFAHVPRCAGSSIEDYLGARFGQLGFLDRSFLSIPVAGRWNQCSPQHIDVRSLMRLLPAALFDAIFAVVRHPVDRIVSVYRFQRDIAGLIPADTGFGDWLAELESQYEKDPFCYDNHAQPATNLIPERNAKIFRLEDGLAPVVDWLDELAGNQDGPREMVVSNTYAQRLDREQVPAGPASQITETERGIIEEIFAADYKRFGYAESAAPEGG